MSGQMKNIHRITIDAGDLLNYANIPSYFKSLYLLEYSVNVDEIKTGKSSFRSSWAESILIFQCCRFMQKLWFLELGLAFWEQDGREGVGYRNRFVIFHHSMSCSFG